MIYNEILFSPLASPDALQTTGLRIELPDDGPNPGLALPTVRQAIAVLWNGRSVLIKSVYPNAAKSVAQQVKQAAILDGILDDKQEGRPA